MFDMFVSGSIVVVVPDENGDQVTVTVNLDGVTMERNHRSVSALMPWPEVFRKLL